MPNCKTSRAYDAAGQTTNITEKTSSGTVIALYKLGWDAAARMATEYGAPLPHTATVPTRNMTFDDDNRLTGIDGNTVTMDLDGNMTSGPLTNDTVVSYTFDARNRLITAGGLGYSYDPAGNRTAITNGAVVTKFVINPNAKLSQALMRIQNGVTNYYIYGAGLLYQVTEQSTATNTLTYHYDYRGSTVALTDGNGNVTDRIEYSAYATMTYRSGTNDTPFLFNGRYGVMTDANGLMYMRARYYNPFISRFINPDPTGFSGGLNFYAYADGNPVSYMDPFGLSPNWGRVGRGAGEFAASIIGFIIVAAAEPETLGGATFALAGPVYAWHQGLIDMAAGAVNSPVSIPSNPGAAIGSNFGPTSEKVGGFVWDTYSLNGSMTEFLKNPSVLTEVQAANDTVSAGLSLNELFGENNTGQNYINIPQNNMNPSFNGESPGLTLDYAGINASLPANNTSSANQNSGWLSGINVTYPSSTSYGSSIGSH